MKKILFIFIVPALFLVSAFIVRITTIEQYYVNSWGSQDCPHISQLYKLRRSPPQSLDARDYVAIQCVNSTIYFPLFSLSLFSFLLCSFIFLLFATASGYQKYVKTKSVIVRIAYDVVAVLVSSIVIIFLVTLVVIMYD